MIALLQNVSDSTVAPITQLHHMVSAAVPNIWVMAGITAGLLLFLSYLLRTPHQFPLRGMVMAFSALAFAGSAVVLGTQIWDMMRPRIVNPAAAAADAKAAEQQSKQAELEQQPVQALETYVPPMPGADAGTHREVPSVNGMPSGTVWDELTNQSVAQVVKYYSADDNHAGWQVEFSAPNGIVLRRTSTLGGQLANERLRIQARPNIDPHGKKTEIEFELTRRLK